MKISVVMARNWNVTEPSRLNARSSVHKGLKMFNCRHIKFSNPSKFQHMLEILVIEEHSAVCFDIQVGISESQALKATLQKERLEDQYFFIFIKDV